MKHRLNFIAAIALFFSIVFLSSFVLLDTFEAQNPLLPKAFDLVNDNKVLSALIISETAPFLSKKVHGIVQGALVLLKAFFRLFHKS